MKAAFILPGMKGGGAERVAALLANGFKNNDIDIRYILTHAKANEIIRCDLDEDIPLVLFKEQARGKSFIEKLFDGIRSAVANLLCKPFELLNKPVPAGFAKLSVTAQYHTEISQLRKALVAEPDLIAIAFLQTG